MQVNFLAVILEFKWFILTTIVGGILLSFLGYLFCKKTEWYQIRFKFLGLFINLKTLDVAWLCTVLSRCFFVISVVVFCTKMETVHIYFYILLCLSYNLLNFRVMSILFDLINSAIIFAALLAGNILVGYLQEVIFDWRTLTVYILLAFFIILYSIYFLLRDISSLVSETGRQSDVVVK